MLTLAEQDHKLKNFGVATDPQSHHELYLMQKPSILVLNHDHFEGNACKMTFFSHWIYDFDILRVINYYFWLFLLKRLSLYICIERLLKLALSAS